MANEEQTLQFMMQSMEQYSSVAKNMSEALGALIHSFLDMMRDNTGAKELKKYLDERDEHGRYKHKPAVYFAKKGHEHTLERMLDKEGISYVNCRREDLDGNVMFMVADKDVARVDRVFNKFRAERSQGGMIPKEVLWDQADGNVLKIKNVPVEDLLLFAEKAKHAGVNIALQGEHDILFDRKDAPTMERVAASVSYDRSGKAGEILAKQARYENENACRIGEAAIKANERPFYIVDRKSGVAMCTDRSLEYMKDGERTYFRKPLVPLKHDVLAPTEEMKREYQKLNAFVVTLDHPIDLTEKEYRKYKTLDRAEKARFLEQIDKEHGKPEITSEDRQILKLHESGRDVMEEKIYQDSINDYEPDKNEHLLRPGVFREEERMQRADTTQIPAIEKEDKELLENAVKKKNRYIFEKEYMSPKIEKYFEEAAEGKEHSRTYEEVRTVEYAHDEDEERPESREEAWEEKEYDDTEWADAWDKDDNGIPDPMQDRNGNGILDDEERF